MKRIGNLVETGISCSASSLATAGLSSFAGLCKCLVSFTVQITDFGLSRWKRYSYEVSGRQSNEGGGTVTHIPPENWRDINRPRDQQFDVYGFAVLLWETFSEQRPFHKRLFFIASAVFSVFCT